MIINDILNYIFSAKSSVAILRQLEQRIVGLTGREISRLSNITPQAAHNTLSKLEALNLVNREYAGKSHIFKLNRKNYFFENIIQPLFDSERNLVANIYDDIKKMVGEQCISIILFGSVARKAETYESDLDICFIYSRSKIILENSVSNLRDTLNERYGIALAPFYISESEFRRRAKSNKSPVGGIIKEGKVICGKSMKRIING